MLSAGLANSISAKVSIKSKTTSLERSAKEANKNKKEEALKQATPQLFRLIVCYLDDILDISLDTTAQICSCNSLRRCKLFMRVEIDAFQRSLMLIL